VLDTGTTAAMVLGVIDGVNAVIALYYCAAIAREMWMSPIPDGDTTPVRVPAPLVASLGLTSVVVLAIGVYPQLFAHFGDLGTLVVR